MAHFEESLPEQEMARFHAIQAKRLRGPQTMQRLRGWGDKSVTLLSNVVAHDDLKFHSWAVMLLGQLQNRKAIPVLIQTLGIANVGVQLDAVQALATYRKEALRELIAALPSASTQQRKGIIQALGMIQDPLVFPYLQAALQDPDTTLRVVAINALGQLGDTRAVAFLLRYVDDEDSAVRHAVIDALGMLQDQRAVPALITALQDPDWDMCVHSIEALEQIGDHQSALFLVEYLSHSSATVRAKTAEALGSIGNPAAVRPLLRLLQDEALADLGNPLPVNVPVTLALGRLGDLQAVEPIIQLLLNSSNTDTRWAAATALGTLGASQAQLALRKVQQYDDSEVSWGGETVAGAAAQALIHIDRQADKD